MVLRAVAAHGALLFAGLFCRVWCSSQASATPDYRAEAFGSNLLGALVGGLLDSCCSSIGLNALVLVAALFYGLSLVSRCAAVPAGGRYVGG